MGSVKDLNIIKEPQKESAGVGRFNFSDRYSVFDWGEMPQHIENKGKSLCIIGAYFFEKLHSMGIKTHYRGLVEGDEAKQLKDLTEASGIMEVNLLRVIEPMLSGAVYSYAAYYDEKNNFLIPLEIIYRNYLPPGSSIYKRLQQGEVTLEELGLDRLPGPGQQLVKPIYDVSTKLEATDRYVNWKEAQKMACLTEGEIKDIQSVMQEVNTLISKETREMGLMNNDGKMELGFDENRDIVIVDVIGTPDECRFTSGNVPVSKEIARIFYRATDWYEAVNEAKKKNRTDWKNQVGMEPPLLPEKLALLTAQLYQAFANELSGRKWFDVPYLSDVLRETADILSARSLRF
ncbi:MAG: phosphoribosylaminoimidazolesuccinocarboxamide synthase [Elusimicrobiota bacterium]